MSKRKFCILFATKNYYEMFEECVYKFSKADWNDVVVLNVDINSTPESITLGREICKKYNIHFVNPSDRYTSVQSAPKAADEYLTKHNIDVDWIMYFEHDVVPIQADFWERVDKCIDSIPDIENKVGMFGANTFMHGGSGNYSLALKNLETDDIITKRKLHTVTGRGNLTNGILEHPHSGWYGNLPDAYYQEEYFVVEIPNWTCSAFNRKLLRECVVADNNFEFNMWADDIAHQYLFNGYIHISFTDLMVCHDPSFTPSYLQNRAGSNEFRHQKDISAKTLLDKWGWGFGKRNKHLTREQFTRHQAVYKNTLQEQLFNLSISDGPKKIEDFELRSHNKEK